MGHGATKSSFANKVRNFPNAADVCAPFFGSTKDRENHIINLQYHGDVLTKYGSQAAIAMARQINIGWPPSKKFCPVGAPWPWQRLPQSGSEAGPRLNDRRGGRTELQIAFRTLLSAAGFHHWFRS